MKYGAVKRAVLELINQSTIAGQDVALTYNNQADYVRRIPNLINHAILKIRTTIRPERAVAQLTDGTNQGNWRVFPLPANCRQVLSGGVSLLGPGGPEHTSQYRLLGRSIAVPLASLAPSPAADQGDGDREVLVEYETYPVQLPVEAAEDGCPPDDWELEEAPEILQAAEYYAAAMLVQMEDEFTFSVLMNEYEDRKARMAPRLTAELGVVSSPYMEAYREGVAEWLR